MTDKSSTILKQAISMKERGEIELAAHLFLGVLKKDPNEPLTYYYLADIFEKQGDNDRATSAYQSFIELVGEKVNYKESVEYARNRISAMHQARGNKQKPQEIVVDQWGKGHFQTVSEAVAAAVPWSTIFIQKGIYQEHIKINKPLILKGKGNAAEIIIRNKGEPAISASGEQVEINNLFLQNQSEKTAGPPAIVISSGLTSIIECDITAETNQAVCVAGPATGLRIERCDVHDCAGWAIVIRNNAHAEIMNSRIFNNQIHGVSCGEKSSMKLENCELFSNLKSALFLEGGSFLEGTSCNLHKNKENAVYCLDSTMNLSNFSIHDNYKNGILAGGSKIIVQNSEFYRQYNKGIDLENDSNFNLLSNQFSENKVGVFITKNTSGAILDCSFNADKDREIEIIKTKNVEVKNCKFQDFKTNSNGAITFFSSSGCLITNCEFKKCSFCGMSVYSSNVKVKDCTMTLCSAGVVIVKNSAEKNPMISIVEVIGGSFSSVRYPLSIYQGCEVIFRNVSIIKQNFFGERVEDSSTASFEGMNNLSILLKNSKAVLKNSYAQYIQRDKKSEVILENSSVGEYIQDKGVQDKFQTI